MPISCSKAAISSCSRWRSSKFSRAAQAEQVSATRIEWLAVAACLHCKAANRLPAMPSRRLANWSSVDFLGRERQRLPAGSDAVEFLQQRAEFGHPTIGRRSGDLGCCGRDRNAGTGKSGHERFLRSCPDSLQEAIPSPSLERHRTSAVHLLEA